MAETAPSGNGDFRLPVIPSAPLNSYFGPGLIRAFAWALAFTTDFIGPASGNSTLPAGFHAQETPRAGISAIGPARSFRCSSGSRASAVRSRNSRISSNPAADNRLRKGPENAGRSLASVPASSPIRSLSASPLSFPATFSPTSSAAPIPETSEPLLLMTEDQGRATESPPSSGAVAPCEGLPKNWATEDAISDKLQTTSLRRAHSHGSFKYHRANGFKQSSRTTAPGCTGFFIAMSPNWSCGQIAKSTVTSASGIPDQLGVMAGMIWRPFFR